MVRQIVKHINRHNNLEARVDRVEERSRQVCITDDTTCGRCRARIGTKLFVLFPDDSIVCYKVLCLSIDIIFPETYFGNNSELMNWNACCCMLFCFRTLWIKSFIALDVHGKLIVYVA